MRTQKSNLFTAIAILAILLANLQTAQSQNQLRGNLSDKSGQSLAAATVLLLNAADSSLVKGQICTTDGNFFFEQISAGDYRIRVSLIGFADLFSSIISLNNQPGIKDLGKITVEENTAQLNEVQVLAKRPFLEQKIDRTIVNVANSITNAGGTALQVLQRSPGVQVNQLTKTISLVGKEGVVVMINGKISRLPSDAVVQMLNGMNADNIDRIELIHTPPANFEAEGNAGIINIILKNSGDEGLNGGYSAKGGYGRGGKYGAAGNVNYRHKKVNFFGGYDYDFTLNPQVFTSYRGVRQGNDFLETNTNSDRPHTPTATQNARLGADFQVSPKTVIGVLGSFFDRNWEMNAFNSVTYSKNGNVESRLNMPNSEINHSRSFTGNINLAQQISANQSLNLDADFIHYNNNNPSYYLLQNLDAASNPTTQSELRIGKKTPIKVAVLKADYNLNIGKKLKLEAGGKFTSLRFDNTVSVESREPQQDWMVISDLTSLFHLNENVEAAYTSFSAKINEKTDLKAGLRYEYTNTNLGSAEQPNLVDRHYGSWFPSVFLTHNLTKIQSLNLSYSRRITRPQIRQLAPWLIFIDPTTIEGGNTAIQPSFTNALKLDYGFKSWRFGVSYSIEDQPMRYVSIVDAANNRQVNRPENLDNETVLSFNLFAPLHPTKWWDMQNNIFVNNTVLNLELEGKKIQLRNVNYGFNSTQTFKLKQGVSLEVSGNYNAPGYWGIAYWKATSFLNVGIEKDFGSKWGKLRFNASDIFESSNWFGETNQPEINLMTRASFQFAEHTFMLSWSKNFGNNKLKAERKRQAAATEEMQRL